jgi:N utilization substance protein A
MSKEIVEAVRGLAAEKNISSEKLMEALEDALLSAYKKTPGSARFARVEIDRDSGDFIVWELKIPPELEEKVLASSPADLEPTVDPETGEMREPPEPELDPEKLAEYEDQIDTEDVTPHDFGRIAAQTAKQVILQRIREAERDMMFEEYRDRVGELITGIVQQSDSRYTLVQLRERVEALLPKSEQVDGERYDHSQRIKAVIKDVSNSTKGPSIIVSRRDPELIKQLFELEVPEIADGLVEITGVAREPGYRSKIAVVSHVDGVDPVGACVGPRGSRVRMVVSELRGEKIDIIPYNDEPARFVAKALSPARVREVLVDDAGKQATVIVPDDQLSLAIGREGQNARLASPAGGSTFAPRPSSPPRRPSTGTTRKRSRAVVPRFSPTAAVARTPRCPDHAIAACRRIRRWPRRTPTTSELPSPSPTKLPSPPPLPRAGPSPRPRCHPRRKPRTSPSRTHRLSRNSPSLSPTRSRSQLRVPPSPRLQPPSTTASRLKPRLQKHRMPAKPAV